MTLPTTTPNRREHTMTTNNNLDVNKTRAKLLKAYPECLVDVVPDQPEMVAGISDGFAVAVIGRSPPDFHITNHKQRATQ